MGGHTSTHEPDRPALEPLVAAARRVARFMETLDGADRAGVFSGGPVAIVENFAPFVFAGRGGWAFALVRERGDWRVAGYGWAPTGRVDG